MPQQLTVTRRRQQQRERRLKEEYIEINKLIAELYPQQRQQLARSFSWIRPETSTRELFRRQLMRPFRWLNRKLQELLARVLRSGWYTELSKRLVWLFLHLNKDLW